MRERERKREKRERERKRECERDRKREKERESKRRKEESLFSTYHKKSMIREHSKTNISYMCSFILEKLSSMNRGIEKMKKIMYDKIDL